MGIRGDELLEQLATEQSTAPVTDSSVTERFRRVLVELLGGSGQKIEVLAVRNLLSATRKASVLGASIVGTGTVKDGSTRVTIVEGVDRASVALLQVEEPLQVELKSAEPIRLDSYWWDIVVDAPRAEQKSLLASVNNPTKAESENAATPEMDPNKIEPQEALRALERYVHHLSQVLVRSNMDYSLLERHVPYLREIAYVAQRGTGIMNLYLNSVVEDSDAGEKSR